MKESQQIAAEHRGVAGHAHLAGAERRGQQDHLTGHESSRQALEHSDHAYLIGQQEHEQARTAPRPEGSADEPSEQKIAVRAYALWEGRGCPVGSPDEDWFRAVEEMRSGQ